MAKDVKKVAIVAGVIITGILASLFFWKRAKIKLKDLVISPEVVNPGQEVTISVTAFNDSSSVLTGTINLGGAFMAQQAVTLGPGESTVVSFTATPAAAKTYAVTVDGLSGSFVCTLAPVADIRLSDLVITPTACYIGDEVTIEVTATNYGTVPGSKTITCTVM